MKTMELSDILFEEISEEEALRNVAQIVQELTTVTRYYNGKGRSRTYNGGIDEIAGAAKQLAQMVLDMLVDKGGGTT